MSEEKKEAPPWMTPEEGDEVAERPAPETSGESEEAEVDVEAAAEAGEAVSSEPDLAETVVQLEEELQQTKARLLRVAADFENYRKRSQREQEEARVRGREEVLRELLAVFDNLERAVEAALTHDSTEALAAILEGVTMVQRQFADGMAKFGIKQFASMGLPFDPNLHEAMAQIASAEYPPGVVVQEYQKGWTLGDRLLRAAMVVVSSAASTGVATAQEHVESAEDDTKTIEFDTSEASAPSTDEEN